MNARLWSAVLAVSVCLLAGASAQQRPLTDPGDRFFPAFATPEERYAREVYLELMRVQPGMIDKKYERHRRNATAEVSFTVGKSGQVRSLKIARSSGDPELDKIIVSTIEATRFSPPPAGVTADFLLPLKFQLN
ncbi:MAG: energy transducer TonB [Pseudorhodoplanes sp.]|uniref:energy transducer TonB family protein n=1 Tax=Pseudorhodoplanes sp. TaxID=1934341 RepID=UPI003D0E0CC6